MMTNKELEEKAMRLEEIKVEIEELAREAIDLLRDTEEYERARCYWYAHIRMALDNSHEYLGGSMCTIQDSIDSLDDYITVECITDEREEGDEE